MEMELQAANERLLQKRAELGVMENPGPSISKSLNDFELPKCKHGVTYGIYCEKCYAAHEEQESVAIAQREAEIRQERTEHPERWLANYGVSKRFIDCSFDNFRGGEKIKEALSLFPKNNIMLSGATGSGKTHLAIATLRGMVQRDEVKRVYTEEADISALFITIPDLLLKIRSCFSKNEDESRFVDCFARTGILILDDLGADKATEWAITTLYLIIDRRYRELMPTIITTNLTIGQIEEQYGARIASRLSDMKIISIKLPDYRKKRD